MFPGKSVWYELGRLIHMANNAAYTITHTVHSTLDKANEKGHKKTTVKTVRLKKKPEFIDRKPYNTPYFFYIYV